MLIAGLVPFVTAQAARAQSVPATAADRFELSARAETYLALFQRALLPGANGALVVSQTRLPVSQYLSLRARDLDGPLQKDGLDLEFAGWASAIPVSAAPDPTLDGDVQTLFANVRRGPVALRLGRQQFVGGAARFARFDGALVSAALGAGISAQAYGGFTVLPRFHQRPGYYYLGSQSELLRNPELVDHTRRAGNWLGGARLDFESEHLGVSASFHEQRDDSELSHRNWGLEMRASAGPALAAAASGIVDVDSARIADGRVWLDVVPIRALTTSVEYLHTEPALWLSRNSVLSVFSTDRVDEAGGRATLRVARWLSFDGSSYVTVFDGHGPGGRSDVAARLGWGALTWLRLSYGRVVAPSNAYHSVRSSLSHRLPAHWALTAEAYGYFYDRAISGYRVSTVYAGTLSYEPAPRWSLLWGASLTHSPYAALDAQTLLRATFAFDLPSRGLR